VIYVDSSVALAYLFGEGRSPSPSFWSQDLTSSRILEYEIWNRIHARQLGQRLDPEVRRLLSHVDLIELAPVVFERALDPFPAMVRTLDGLHLASMEFMRKNRQDVELASYDNRLNAAARALGIPLAPL
jgi:predicted nucleic acid-binding protein